MNYVLRILLCIGIILFPLYIFDSGNPQPSHIALLLFSTLCLLFALSKIKIDLFLLSTFIVVVLREIIYIPFNLEFEGLKSASFLLFNTVLYTALNTYMRLSSAQNRETSFKWIRFGVSFAIAVALYGIFVFGEDVALSGEVERRVGTFNNPNQLGYFSLCSAGILILLRMHGQLGNIQYLLLILVATLLSLYSLSKAAMVSMLFIVIGSVWVFLPNSRFKPLLMVVSITIFVSTLSLFTLNNLDSLSDYAFIKRLANMGSDNDDSLAGRGYYLVQDMNPVEWIFGLGSRFRGEYFDREVHSTFFSMFVYYGFLGFSLFMAFYLKLIYLFKRKYGLFMTCLVFLPTFLYGVTHNGSRSSIFWLFLAFAAVSSSMTSSSVTKQNT